MICALTIATLGLSSVVRSGQLRACCRGGGLGHDEPDTIYYNRYDTSIVMILHLYAAKGKPLVYSAIPHTQNKYAKKTKLQELPGL